MKNPSPFSLSFLMLLTLLLLTLSPPPSFAAEDTLIDRIIVTVNQNVITENQLNAAVSDAERSLKATGASIPDAEVLRKKVLDQLIDARLELQAAADAGITVDSADVEKAVGQIAAQNNLSTQTLYKKINEQGMDVMHWKKDIQNQLLIQKMQQQEVGSTITITKEEVNDYLKSLPPPDPALQEYHVRDLLIPLPDDPSTKAVADAQKLADALAAQLRQNKKIDISAITIQDRGWQTLSQMPAAFAQAISGMKSHTFSSPIRTGNGFHILSLTGIRQPDADKLTPAEIRKKLFEQKYESGVKKWISLLRSRATIQYPTS